MNRHTLRFRITCHTCRKETYYGCEECANDYAAKHAAAHEEPHDVEVIDLQLLAMLEPSPRRTRRGPRGW